jgi:hypothetical protein
MLEDVLETLRATVTALEVLYAEAMSEAPNRERMEHVHREVMTGAIGAPAVIAGAEEALARHG